MLKMRKLKSFGWGVRTIVAVTAVAVLLLVLSQGSRAQSARLALSGAVLGDTVPDGQASLAFHFFDAETQRLAHRSVGNVEFRDGEYTADLPAGPLRDGGEFWVYAASPETSLASMSNPGP